MIRNHTGFSFIIKFIISIAKRKSRLNEFFRYNDFVCKKEKELK